jgi:hypothetical protein
MDLARRMFRLPDTEASTRILGGGNHHNHTFAKLADDGIGIQGSSFITEKNGELFVTNGLKSIYYPQFNPVSPAFQKFQPALHLERDPREVGQILSGQVAKEPVLVQQYVPSYQERQPVPHGTRLWL